MKYLLDTCAISDLRKPECPESLRQLIETTDDTALFLSAVTLGEIQKGVSLLPAGKRRQEFQAWLAFVQSSFDDRILPVTAETALIWGQITARCQQAGHTLHSSDGLIAATAIQFGLHLVTRNISDFEPTGALIINPWLD
jgi:predicted nucleic acid-binding protein